MGRIENNNKKNKIKNIIEIILLVLIATIGFTRITYASTLDRSTRDHTSNYQVPLYITYEMYKSDPYLLCTGKGIGLPGYGSTTVVSGSYSTHVTDQGKDTGKLTASDLGAATVFADGTYKGLVATTSKTYGYFTTTTTHLATPAEAYVLSELDDNLAGSGVTYNKTSTEYTGTVYEETAITVGDDVYYVVETNDQEATKMVYKGTDGKYYLLDIEEGEAGGDSSAVQYAWWAVATTQEGSRVDPNSLANEATAFESYINSISEGGSYKTTYDTTGVEDISSVTLDFSKVSMTVGQTRKLTLSMTPTNVGSRDVTWTTSNKNVVTVSSTGLLTGVAEGTATITVVAKDDTTKKASCKVTVSASSSSSDDGTTSWDDMTTVNEEDTGTTAYSDMTDVNGLEVDKSEIVLQTGSSTEVTVFMDNESDGYEATSADKKIAKVSNDDGGMTFTVKAIKAGTTTITVKNNYDSNDKATIKVTVKDTLTDDDKNIDVYKVVLDKSKISVKVGNTKKITATVYPTDATNTNVTFKSSDTSVATVNSKGKVTGVKAGTATITVTSEGDTSKTAKCKVTVTDDSSSSVEVEAQSVDGTYQGSSPSYTNVSFDVNYEPTVNETDPQVLYDSETNTYKIGPFSINYIRSVYQYGDRDVADFAGIVTDYSTVNGEAGSVLTGTFTLDDGTTEQRVISTENYKFIYEHDHSEYINNDVDTVESYPYPYSDEEFYIELDYMDDLTEIAGLDFNFHYMNGGGTYTVYHGTYLVIKWKVQTTYLATSSNASTSNVESNSSLTLLNNLGNGINLEKVSNAYGEDEVDIDTSKVTLDLGQYMGTTRGMAAGTNGQASIKSQNISDRSDTITITIQANRRWKEAGTFSLGSNTPSNITISNNGDRTATITITRDYTKIYDNFSVTIYYKYEDGTNSDGSTNYETDTTTLTGWYNNTWYEYNARKVLANADLKLVTSTEHAGIANEGGTYYIYREGFMGGSSTNNKDTEVEITCDGIADGTLGTETSSSDLNLDQNVMTISKSPISGNVTITIYGLGGDYIDGHQLYISFDIEVGVKAAFFSNTDTTSEEITLEAGEISSDGELGVYNLNGECDWSDETYGPQGGGGFYGMVGSAGVVTSGTMEIISYIECVGARYYLDDYSMCRICCICTG